MTFENRQFAEAYHRESGMDWPILLDRDRRLYQAYGMHRAGAWSIWQPSSWWIYAKLLLRGRRLRLPSDDIRQLGGDVLIDPRGIVRLHHVGSGPADRPPVSRILEIVDQGTDATDAGHD